MESVALGERFGVFHNLVQIGQGLGIGFQLGQGIPRGAKEPVLASAAAQEPDAAADQGSQGQAADADQDALSGGALLRHHGNRRGLLPGLLIILLLIGLLLEGLGLVVRLLSGLGLPGLPVVLLLSCLRLIGLRIVCGFGIPDGLRRRLLGRGGLGCCLGGKLSAAVGTETGAVAHRAAAVGTEHNVSSF